MTKKKPAAEKKKPNGTNRLYPDKDINGVNIYSKGKDTARKEAFAVAFFKTKSKRQAYHEAYTADGMCPRSVLAAATKIHRDPYVQDRLEEMNNELRERTHLSLEEIIYQLQEDRLLAHREGQASAAVMADMHMAKILGFYWDRRQIIVSDDFDAMNIDELRAYVENKTQALGIANPRDQLALEYAPGDYKVEDVKEKDGR